MDRYDLIIGGGGHRLARHVTYDENIPPAAAQGFDADAPDALGCVLIGDAAGWNDPIIGLGLSITDRDVRMVSDIPKSTDDWSTIDFAPCAAERGATTSCRGRIP